VTIGDLPSPPEPKTTPAGARSAARLAVVQALYQMEVTARDASAVIREFVDHRLGREMEGEPLREADETFFAELTRGVVARQDQIDRLVNGALSEGWRLARVDSILRAILRAGVCELLTRDDVPPKVTITEYVDVAHAFFEGEEPRFVNGVLDRLARTLRGDELSGPPPG